VEEKLIRSKLVNVISKENWYRCSYKKSNELLKKKLYEEINELKETDFKDINEYADVLEVLYELIERNDLTRTEVEKVRMKKKLQKGGFDEIVLKDTR
jgi:predicted house-cleaning noncanonical NTP pyrophosphatase (MazG superfamily)